MKSELLLILIMLGLWAGGCLPENDEKRCNGNYVWNPETLSCKLIEQLDASSASDAGSEEEGFGRNPTGMGESCLTSEDCAGYQARLCLASAARPDGYCTVVNCTTEPDSCPSEYRCCVLANASLIETQLDVPEDIALSAICFNLEMYQIVTGNNLCTQ